MVMSRLHLIRHAQASFGSADYDQLSELGEEQSRRLGTHWAEQAWDFDRVYVGPRRRHQRTAELAGAALRAHGRGWTDPEVLAELDEYAGLQVFRAVAAQTGLKEAMLAAQFARPPSSESVGPSGDAVKLELLKQFQGTMARWVSGELVVPDVETWADFRARARRVLQGIMANCPNGQRIAIFTSTGPIATALDLALNLQDQAMMETSWQLRNTSVSEFLFSSDRFTLSTFNTLPHLSAGDRRLITHI